MNRAAPRADIVGLCSVAMRTLDMLAEAGQESTDIVRLWLEATLRWARGKADDREVSPYTRALGKFVVRRPFRPTAEDGLGRLAVVCGMIRTERGRSEARIISILRMCTSIRMDCTGDPHDAAAACVSRWFWEAADPDFATGRDFSCRRQDDA